MPFWVARPVATATSLESAVIVELVAKVAFNSTGPGNAPG